MILVRFFQHFQHLKSDTILPQNTKHYQYSDQNEEWVYINHLNTGQVWYLNGRFVSGCQMVQHSNDGLETRLKKACLWSKMSGFQMVCQVRWQPFEYRTLILSSIQMVTIFLLSCQINKGQLPEVTIGEIPSSIRVPLLEARMTRIQ